MHSLCGEEPRCCGLDREQVERRICRSRLTFYSCAPILHRVWCSLEGKHHHRLWWQLPQLKMLESRGIVLRGYSSPRSQWLGQVDRGQHMGQLGTAKSIRTYTSDLLVASRAS